MSVLTTTEKSGYDTHVAAAAPHAGHLKADGSVALTADQSCGGHKLTSLGSGTAASDATALGQEKVLLTFGSANVGASTAARFVPRGGATANVLTADSDRYIVPAGVLKNMRLRQQGAGTTGSNNQYWVNVNGVNTGITATIDNATTTLTVDTTHTVTVNDGDEVSFQVTRAATTTAASNFTSSVSLHAA